MKKRSLWYVVVIGILVGASFGRVAQAEDDDVPSANDRDSRWNAVDFVGSWFTRKGARQADAAVALLKMNQPEKVWPLLRHSPDPTVRSYLIHRFAMLGADARAIVKRLDDEPDITIRRALLLSLGEYGEKGLPSDLRTDLLPKLETIYRTDADPGLHAAVEWLLRQWKQQAWLKQVNDEWAKDTDEQKKRLESIQQTLAKDKEKTPPQWYVNSRGQTMVVIPGPVEFMMGAPRTELGWQGTEPQHMVRIGRSFALAAKTVTMEQFDQFETGYQRDHDDAFTRTADLPAVGIDWYRAAKYCDWLNEKEGIPKDERCYKVVGDVVRLKANYLSLSGYRLPTEAEMEYATRAGAVTRRHYGESDDLLPKYAWYKQNSQQRTWPVGSLKPNDFGFFDMQGNVFSWCQETSKDYPLTEPVSDDKEDEIAIDNDDTIVYRDSVFDTRVLRGGSFDSPASYLRSAARASRMPSARGRFGFRLARTLPAALLTP